MITNRKRLNEELYAIHPALSRIFYDFKKKYSQFRLIDLEAIICTMPLTIDEFTRLAETQVKAKKELLIKNWLQECSKTVSDSKDSIEAIMPINDEVIKKGNTSFNTII